MAPGIPTILYNPHGDGYAALSNWLASNDSAPFVASVSLSVGNAADYPVKFSVNFMKFAEKSRHIPYPSVPACRRQLFVASPTSSPVEMRGVSKTTATLTRKSLGPALTS